MRILTALLVMLALVGCGSGENSLQQGMALRDKLLANSCSFQAEIVADYGNETYTFRMGCTVDPQGTMKFVVLAPESISGITGNIKSGNGYLTFDEAVLTFPLLAEGEVTPVSAPWLLIYTLQGGYLVSAGMAGENTILTLRDSYKEGALQLDVSLDGNQLPQSAEIFWQGRRVLSVRIDDFTFV